MVDFNKYISPEMYTRIEKRKAEENKRYVGEIEAYDEENNRYKKKVSFNADFTILSFGWPVEYYFDSLYENIEKNKTATKFSIDMCGRNHKGTEVYIGIKDLKLLLEKAKLLRSTFRNIGLPETSMSSITSASISEIPHSTPSKIRSANICRSK